MSRVLLDANVLYSQNLRDVLVQLASDQIFEARWSAEIHAEWKRNVLANRPDLATQKLDYTQFLMDKFNPRALVSGFEPLIETLHLPDPNDRHVLAAAIHSGCEFLVTFNLKDFPESVLQTHTIKALSPDTFLLHLLETQTASVLKSLSQQRQRLRRPPLSSEEFLNQIRRQGLKNFASALETHQEKL